jgi:ferric-dicitrate binding protein FerR (iron transport regulator)
LGHPEQIDLSELHQRARRIRDARRKARRRPERARRRREAGRGLLAFALMMVVLWLLFRFLS